MNEILYVDSGCEIKGELYIFLMFSLRSRMKTTFETTFDEYTTYWRYLSFLSINETSICSYSPLVSLLSNVQPIMDKYHTHRHTTYTNH